MRRIITWQVVGSILTISFIGLFACRLVDQFFYGGKYAFGKTPVGSFVTILFAIAWCVGLVVLVPLSDISTEHPRFFRGSNSCQ
jgi:uncharacterized membrane protein